MPDTPAERVRRSRAHKAGDHSLCRPERCPHATAPSEPVTSGNAPPAEVVELVVSVQAEINNLPAKVRASALAASARRVATLLAEATPREAAALSRELRATLADLRQAAAEAPKEADPVDEVKQRRDQRRAAAASAHSTGG